jgi:phage shock protein A
MMSFFGRLWQQIRGIFIRAGDDLVSGSPEAIRASYATAIDDAKRRYKDLQEAVAMLAHQREKTASRLKTLDDEEKDVQKKLEGSLTLAESEPDNPAHREAGTRYLKRLQELEGRQGELAEELDAQSSRVQEYMAKLRTFMSQIDKLKKEQGEMVAEFVSNRQVLQLENRLKGLGDTAIDESLVAIRDKVGQLKAQARIASEMREGTTTAQDETYERVGAEKLAESRFDELLEARIKAKAGATEKERDLG